MNKHEIVSKYHNIEDRMLISKVMDKMEQCEKRDCICMTEFLDQYQRRVVEDCLKQITVSFLFYGGYEEANRVNCIFYPDHYTESDVTKEYGEWVDIIRIALPRSLEREYQHRDYLGSVIKLGMKREKTGDILCDETGADLIVLKEATKYLINNLPSLTRFSKAKFEVIPVEEIRKIEIRKQTVRIISSSLRIDNVIAELLGTSRTKANELLAEKRVFINYQNEVKSSKLIKEKDILVIRGKGKYEFNKIEGNTKKNRFVLTFLKYV